MGYRRWTDEEVAAVRAGATVLPNRTPQQIADKRRMMSLPRSGQTKLTGELRHCMLCRKPFPKKHYLFRCEGCRGLSAGLAI